MATESTSPLDLYRANLGLELCMLSVWREGRQQACELEMLREYLAATTNLWQQGLVSAVKQQNACIDGMRDAFARWQAAWRGEWQTGAGMTSTTMPLQEWMQRFEQTVRDAPDGRAEFGPDMNSAAPPTAARSRAAQGDRHVG
ncbi:hypothetical protein [Paraburkholderia sp. RL17-337-BIB-A]|uniref:hypothetical protein n=1 Tax=Paraburkholderia sp. RL17-337-BIB-A TaxID=3031636 RepID=UPI0038BC8CE4